MLGARIAASPVGNWIGATACISFVGWCEYQRAGASRLFYGPFKNILLLPYYILLLQTAAVVNNLIVMVGWSPPVSFFTQLFAVNSHFLGFMTMAVLLSAASSSVFMILIRRRYGVPQDAGSTQDEENSQHLRS